MNWRIFGSIILFASTCLLIFAGYNYYQVAHGLRWERNEAFKYDVIGLPLKSASIRLKIEKVERNVEFYGFVGGVGFLLGLAFYVSGRRPEEGSLASPIPTRSQDMKVCPYCSEEVKVSAVLCRFCGRDLPQKEASERITGEEMAVVLDDLGVTEKDGRFYCAGRSFGTQLEAVVFARSRRVV